MKNYLGLYILLICFLLITLAISCKTRNLNLVDYIYNAKYSKQAIMAYDIVSNEYDATKIGITYIEILFKGEKRNFDEYDSLKAQLVNKDDIWIVELVKSTITNKYIEKTKHTVYLRKKDGALLLYQDNIEYKHLDGTAMPTQR